MTAPWVLYEDDDVLVASKPAGVNTHRADVDAQDGLYEMLVGLSPGAPPALLHRLDKETSGALLLGRSARANRALTEQLAGRAVDKRYLLLVRRDDARPARLHCDDRIAKPRREAPEQEAETDFERLERGPSWELLEARPRTGRTHQVRVHAARLGMPLLGDSTYDGPPAARLFLHAHRLTFDHPAGTGPLTVEAPRPWSFDRVLTGAPAHGPVTSALCALEARAPLVDPAETDAYLWIDRHHDGFPDLRVERLGPVALVLRYDDDPGPLPRATLDALEEVAAPAALWEQRRPRGGGGGPAALVRGRGEARFTVRELGLTYQLDLQASPTSTGLFLDQRETRRRLLGLDLRGKTVLNAFAHTGALSVAAARAGAVTTSLDLSRRYLDWARENLALNALDAAGHDFIYGDALDWMRRLEKKGRRFDLVLVDPPSFSTSTKRVAKGRRSWSVERDLPALVALGARLVSPGGRLFVSTNLRRLPASAFLARVEAGLKEAGRTGQVTPTTLPLDHRTGAQDPPYLKAAWVAL